MKLKSKLNLDFVLIAATIIILFLLSSLCIGGMFYFKIKNLHELMPYEKQKFIDAMNSIAAPLVMALVYVLGLCIPKRVLKGQWIYRTWGAFFIGAVFLSIFLGIKSALLVILIISLVEQIIVVGISMIKPSILHIQKPGYWIRIGSPLFHLALLCFILDLFLFRYKVVHIGLFWLTTISATIGMIFSFWADEIARLFRRIKL